MAETLFLYFHHEEHPDEIAQGSSHPDEVVATLHRAGGVNSEHEGLL